MYAQAQIGISPHYSISVSVQLDPVNENVKKSEMMVKWRMADNLCDAEQLKQYLYKSRLFYRMSSLLSKHARFITT